MSDDVGAKRQRVSEEDYFRKKDRELVERLREAAAADQSRKDLQAKTGVSDPALLDGLRELGFTPETVTLLPLVPIVQMAWAEGGVTAAERKLVVDLARKRGIGEGSPADRQLSDWLDRQPGRDVFSGALRLIAAMTSTGSGAAADFAGADVIASAEAIASASGGLLGIGKVSAEERALLSQIQSAFSAKGR
jgi:hypothetical protein